MNRLSVNIHFRGSTYGMVPTQDWQYGQLFGPGAPRELQLQ
jgi:hypothetical protein